MKRVGKIKIAIKRIGHHQKREKDNEQKRMTNKKWMETWCIRGGSGWGK
jgi:translation initiation factor 2 alpha subunit (eIF-2alpha)